MAIEYVFWIGVTVILYVYAGYPLVLALTTWRRPRPAPDAARPPSVTLIISAYNEAECIAGKLENTLELDYPRELLDVVVVSDASDDGTDEIVRRYTDRGVRLLRMVKRSGKTLGLNAAVAQSSSEIIVFSDANALYRVDAIRRLTAPFVDPAIGAVIGESTYVQPDSESGRSESLYWRYETWIKALESRRGSVVGGDGAIYSVRRALYKPMAADALSDFVNPLQVVRAGFRCVYEPRALSYEEAAADYRREYRRKVRIVNRAWRSLLSMRDMLNPFRHGAFALKLWSHKVLRWWIFAAPLVVLPANVLLFERHWTYRAALALQLAFYALAVGGFLIRSRDRQPFLLRVPFYFCLVNIAAGVGVAQAMGGKSYTMWTTSRAGGNV
jgi:cellulose synthase/poly-beta-1,6-N-acetylglucosamine synthase-like glycosyltransferase